MTVHGRKNKAMVEMAMPASNPTACWKSRTLRGREPERENGSITTPLSGSQNDNGGVVLFETA
jgi:hypothetical protein